MQNTYNKEKPITLYRDIKIAPAIVIAADKAAFFGCQFVSLQDTVGDLIGRHYFQQCHITGIVDFIWGNGQSLYQVYHFPLICESFTSNQCKHKITRAELRDKRFGSDNINRNRARNGGRRSDRGFHNSARKRERAGHKWVCVQWMLHCRSW